MRAAQIRLGARARPLAGAGSRTLGLTARQTRRLAEALERGVRARATTSVWVVDVGGNADTATHTIVVRG